MRFESSKQHSGAGKDPNRPSPAMPNDGSRIHSIAQMQKTIGNRSTIQYLKAQKNDASRVIQRTAITNSREQVIPGTDIENKERFQEYFRLFGHYENCVYILGKLNSIPDPTEFDDELIEIVEARIDELWDKEYEDQPQVELPNKYTYKGSLIAKSVGAPIKDWLEEQGCDLTDDAAIKAVQYAMTYSGLELTHLRGTSSGGQSITIIPEGKDYVIQYFKSEAFEKIKFAYEKLNSADSELKKHFAEIIAIDEGQRIAIMEKIQPINAMFDLANPSEELVAFLAEHEQQIKEDVGTSIHGLAARGISQGDVSVDNMGMKGGKFVLFDYDKATAGNEASVENDLHSLDRSLEHYKRSV